jgi:predicted deacylase
MQPIFEIAGHVIHPGESQTIQLPFVTLYTQTPLNIPINVIHGKKKGPKLLVIATIHGDELNGLEIIRRLLKYRGLHFLRGTLITIPIANIFGFLNLSRYLPDRRDLNRSFPGSKTGSLAARLANLLMEEVVQKCTHGIDLHTGSLQRTNFPQIRVDLETPGAEELAKAFEAPIIIDAKLRDGSLREAAAALKMPFLVYEGGEALRFDDLTIRVGIRGILNILRKLEMLPKKYITRNKPIKPTIAYSDSWVRAPESGIVGAYKNLGDAIIKDEIMGVITDPFAQNETQILAPFDGLIIGRNNLPLVNEGDALFHVAQFSELEKVSSQVDKLQ